MSGDVNSTVNDPLLSVRDLRVWFDDAGREVKAVDGVDFDVPGGEIVGVVGESGSGKSTVGLAVTRLVAMPPGRVVSGAIRFDGCDLLALPPAEMRTIRGRRIATIFQDPTAALHPLMRISAQLMEATRLHLGHTRRQAREHAIAMLHAVGVPDAASRIDHYPHQFSGGMRQRILIAMALSCQPALLIADEPTAALDVTTQAQVLDLIATMTRGAGTSVLLITHDLRVAAGFTDSILVMYAGRIVERARTRALFESPVHPYTRGLLQSTPDVDGSTEGPLYHIPGAPADLSALPSECAFAPRCPWAQPVCREQAPPLIAVDPGHEARCHFARELFQAGAATPAPVPVSASSTGVERAS